MRVLKTNAALLLLLAACSQARVIQVPSDYPTIQAGIDASADGDTVLVAPGTYTGDGNRDIDVRARAVTIKSEEGPQTCIIDCDGSEDDPHRGFRVSGDGVLDGFKVIHGYVKESGGGIDCSDGCIIRNCIVTKNFAEDGGGGISISDGTVVNCIIAENKAYGHGGAILASHGNPVFINCTIVRNQASGEGGGIKCGFRGTATMTNCILVGNRASHGDQILAVDTGIIIRAMALKIGNCCIQSDSCDDLSLEGCASGYASGYRGRSMIELLDGVIYAADPRFADPDNGDFRLRPDSPCIDAGTDAVSIQLPPMDLDGNPRAADGRRDGSNLPDMGAYEFPAPDQPYMWLLPPHLEFVADSGGPNPAPKTLTIQNLGLRPLNWTIRHDSDWLAVSADSGTVGSQTIEVVVTVDSSNLSPGSFACDITISDPNALNNSQAIPVALYVPKILYVPGELSTIQDAIDAANPYDTIVVADGVYEGEGNHDITFGGKPITLRSENGPGNCIIEFRPNQYNRSSVFVFDSGEDRHSILDGFTIIAGPCREIVRCDQSSPTIRNCRIAGRVDVRLGDVGAGIDLSWADAAIENCHIQYCYLAISSGASDALISDCTLQDNYLGLQLLGWSPQLYRCHASRNEREAIYLGGCRETQVVDCTMIQNGKDIWCPAMNCYGSSVVLKRCNVSGNNGGGIDFYSCPNVNVQNCVISANGNYYSTDGYGVRSVGSDILVENSTIAQNIGDGFRCEGYQTVKLPAGMTMAMKNSILWDNEPNQVGGRTDLLSLTHTNVQGGWPGVGNIDVDPLFAQPGNWDPNDTPDDPNDDFWVEGDYHLKSQAGRWDPNSQTWVRDDVTSPCIDAGDPNSPIGYEPFPNGGIVNMGAYGGTTEASKSASAGSIVGWGLDRYGEVAPPEGGDFVAIAAGDAHSLALKSDGSLVGWGTGCSPPPDGNDFVAIAAGGRDPQRLRILGYSLALKSDGSILRWGVDEHFVHSAPPEGNDFVAIAAGGGQSLALKADGSIVGWGNNSSGRATPPDGNDYVAIAAGTAHSLALKADGSVVGWGLNHRGQAAPPDDNDFVAIAAGQYHSLALKSDGSIVGWGDNDHGQATPPDGNNFVAIAAGKDHSLALRADGSVVGWGSNWNGEATPPADNDFVAISAGYSHSLAIKRH